MSARWRPGARTARSASSARTGGCLQRTSVAAHQAGTWVSGDAAHIGADPALAGQSCMNIRAAPVAGCASTAGTVLAVNTPNQAVATAIACGGQQLD